MSSAYPEIRFARFPNESNPLVSWKERRERLSLTNATTNAGYSSQEFEQLKRFQILAPKRKPSAETIPSSLLQFRRSCSLEIPSFWKSVHPREKSAVLASLLGNLAKRWQRMARFMACNGKSRQTIISRTALLVFNEPPSRLIPFSLVRLDRRQD